MPDYQVTFKAPVVYLPGHFRGQRTVTELTVAAPSAEEAAAHALRTTIGSTVAKVVEVK